MRSLRLLLISLALIAGFAALVVGLAFVPTVQTWFVERVLARSAGLHVSVGSVSAGFSRAQLKDIRIQFNSGVLTIPSLVAHFPVTAAWWDGRAAIKTVAANGWTFDVSGQSPSTTMPSSAVDPLANNEVADTLQRAFSGLLGGWTFPLDMSVDEAEFAGDVLLHLRPGAEPTRLHVTIKGGGLASGHTGEFTLEASGSVATPSRAPVRVDLRAKLFVAMNSPRTIQSVVFAGAVTTDDGLRSDDWDLSGEVAVDSAKAERYRIELRRGDRPLASLVARLPFDHPHFQGTWTLALTEGDLARLDPARRMPALTAHGEGSFDVDLAFTRLHFTGYLRNDFDQLGRLAPGLDRLGTGSFESDFDVTYSDRSLRCDHLDTALAATRPIATVRAVQPFDYDFRTGTVRPATPASDWLVGSLQGLPLAWLAGLVDGTAITGGDLDGAFAVTAAAGRFTLRVTAPLRATGLTVLHRGRSLVDDLDLSLALLAEYSSDGWRLQGRPLILTSNGRRLATIEATVLPLREPRLSYAVAGKWEADLDALAARTGFGASFGRATSGDFSIRAGQTTEVRTHCTVLSHAPDRSVTTNAQAYFDANDGVTFKLPLTFTSGKTTTNLFVEGQWTKEKNGRRIDVEVGGVDVDVAHLTRLATALSAWNGVRRPALAGVAPGGANTTPSTRDARPFWGDWIGRAKFDFYRLHSATQEFNAVTGTVRLEPAALRLEGGRAVLAPARVVPKRAAFGQTKADPPRNRLAADGVVLFDAAADDPYHLEATATADVIEAARLFTTEQTEHDPVIEGRFSLAATISSQAVNLQELVERRREEFRLVGKNGIVRLLKTRVSPDIPEDATPVKDAFTKVGSMVGALFGIRKDAIDTGMVKLSKETSAVLDLNEQIQDIRYDDLTLTATRGADHVITVSSFVLTAPFEQLTGSGQIGYVPDLPLRARPFTLDLTIGAKAHIASLLTTAGLLSPEKNALGYALVAQPVRFSGTLEKLDNSAWHDLLVKAATSSVERKKSR